MSTWTDVFLATLYSLLAYSVGYGNGRADEARKRRRSTRRNSP